MADRIGTEQDDDLAPTSLEEVNDNIYGRGGNDRIQGGGINPGFDRLYGEAGNDILFFVGGNGEMWGGEGNDDLSTTLSTSFITGHHVLMDGGAGDDRILHANAPNTPRTTIRGGEGNDQIILHGWNSATVDAGTGNDFVTINGAQLAGVTPRPHRITLGAGNDAVQLTNNGFDVWSSSLFRAVHVITDFTPGQDRLIITTDAYFNGVQGSQQLVGSGNPFALGLIRLVQSGGDTIVQIDRDGAGAAIGWTDAIRLENVLATSITEISGYRVDGSGVVDYTAATTRILTPGTNEMSLLLGGGGNDTLTGNDFRDQIVGQAGNDTIRGGGGADWIYGGIGINSIQGDGGDDMIVTGGDDDEVFGGEGADSLAYERELGSTNDPSSHVLLDGGAGNDAIRLSGVEVLTSVTALGGSGNDIILIAGSGHSVIDAGSGDDVVTVSGNSAVITLGAGADRLNFLYTLLFLPFAEQRRSYVINDFQAGIDTINWDIARFLTTWNGTGNPFALGYLRLLQIGADAVLQRDSNGGGDNYIDFFRITGTAVSALTLAEFGGFPPSGDLPPSQTIRGSGDLTGGAGNDALISTAPMGTSVNLVGGYGDDRIVGGQGTNFMRGGYGNDTYVISHTNSYFSETNEQGLDTGGNDTIELTAYIPGAFTLPDGIENLVFTGSGSAELTGNMAANRITGGTGNDLLRGMAGDDVLDGGAGADAMLGGTGNDIYHVDRQDDLVIELAGEGIDAVIASANFYLYAQIENLTLSGTGDIFGVGNELVNTITGNGGANLLLGGGGDDMMRGGAGGDQLYGEGGIDTMFGEVGVDYLIGGAGDDVLDGGTDADGLYGEDGDDTLIGGGGMFTDILVGGAGNDLLRGDSGLGDYDLMDGGAGNDRYYVDTPDDLVFEAAGGGTDTVYADIEGAGYYLYANIENLVLEGNTPFGVGNTLNNRITGNSTANTLLGGAGDDVLNGMGGGDVLFGEGGADRFVFERGTGGDVIGDFQAGIDRIDLSAFGFTSFAQVQALMGENGGTAFIALGGGDLIVLTGVAASTLSQADFIL